MLKLNITENTRFIFLDWLRIVAFLSVFIEHKYTANIMDLAHDPHTHDTLRILLDFIFPLIHPGAGVVIFFLVSGYIITHVLFKEIALEFIIKRFFRIYPLYFVAIVMQASIDYFMNGMLTDWSTLIKQLSLFGDFFEVPYALSSVEWTLRIEVLFYLVMAILKQAKLLDGKFQFALPVVIIAFAILLFTIPPFPKQWSMFYGYLNLYSPFLVIGVVYYLFEHSKASAFFLLLLILFIFFKYWIVLMDLYPNQKNAHFAIYGFAVFYGLWLLRDKLTLPRWAVFLSELTYSFYLFHNFLYDKFVDFISHFSSNAVSHFISVILLFCSCWFVTIIIERPAIKLGRTLALKYSA